MSIGVHLWYSIDQFPGLLSQFFVVGTETFQITAGTVLGPELIGEAFHQARIGLEGRVVVDRAIEQMGEVVGAFDAPSLGYEVALEVPFNRFMQGFDTEILPRR